MTSKAGLFIWCFLFGLICILILSCNTPRWLKKWWFPNDQFERRFTTVMLYLAISALSCFFIINSRLMMSSGNKMQEASDLHFHYIFITGTNSYEVPPTVFTRWDIKGTLQWYDHELLNFKHTATITTTQGQVRVITYLVRAERFATPAEFMRYRDTIPKHLNTAKYLRSQLNQFTFAQQNEVAQFYDPIDEGQQQALEALFRQFANTSLADTGTKLISLRYEL